MRGVLTFAFAGISMVMACRPAGLEPHGTVYLFDCAGRIQLLDEAAGAVTSVGHVSDLDPTLPEEVRDGCAIREGWYDRENQRLILIVQTRALLEENAVPTSALAIRGDTLLEAGPAGSLEPPATPVPRAEPPSPDDIDIPFDRGVAYLARDGSTLLVEERTGRVRGSGRVELDPFWHEGAVSLRAGRTESTGRYALLDLTEGDLVGGIVSSKRIVHDERVVCFTPSGRVYLSAGRDTLLVLDVMEPERRRTLDDLGLDLWWSTCAWGRT